MFSGQHFAKPCPNSTMPKLFPNALINSMEGKSCFGSEWHTEGTSADFCQDSKIVLEWFQKVALISLVSHSHEIQLISRLSI